MTDENGDHWLGSGKFCCRNCRAALQWVEHSPFTDAWLFYCDRCPRWTEISYYDPTVSRLEQAHHPRIVSRSDGRSEWNPNLIAAMEQELEACTCGGKYRWHAPRHCVSCNAVVMDIDVAIGKDVGLDHGEITSDAQAQNLSDWFHANFIKTKDLWKP